MLDRLAPAERVAFVLHDTFGVPFDEIKIICSIPVGYAIDRKLSGIETLTVRSRKWV